MEFATVIDLVSLQKGQRHKIPEEILMNNALMNVKVNWGAVGHIKLSRRFRK